MKLNMLRLYPICLIFCFQMTLSQSGFSSIISRAPVFSIDPDLLSSNDIDSILRPTLKENDSDYENCRFYVTHPEEHLSLRFNRKFKDIIEHESFLADLTNIEDQDTIDKRCKEVARRISCQSIKTEADVFLAKNIEKDEAQLKKCAPEFRNAANSYNKEQPEYHHTSKTYGWFYMGSNISSVPAEVRGYQFSGQSSEDLTWNHRIHYLIMQPFDCHDAELNNIFLTDRKKWQVGVKEHGFIPTESVPFKIEEWLANQLAAMENVEPFSIENVGPGLYFDVKPRTSFTFRDMAYAIGQPLSNLENRVLLHDRCRVYVHKVISTPTINTITLFKTEAMRLEQLVTNKGLLYLQAKNVQRWIDSYQAPMIKGMIVSVHSYFNDLIKAAMSGTCSSSQEIPPPFLPFSGPVALDVNQPQPADCPGSKAPRDYGLAATDWANLDLVAEKIIARDPKEPKYNLDLKQENAKWFFEAKKRMPKFKTAFEKIIAELAFLHSAVLIKERTADAGYELPDVNQARAELQVAMTSGRSFLSAFEAYTENLKKELAKLKEAIEKDYGPLDVE